MPYIKISGGKKIIDLGTNTTFNVSGYHGYQSFTVSENFIICAKAGSYSQSQNMGEQNTVQHITPSAQCSISVQTNYDASTGILTAKEVVDIYASCSMYRDGYFSKTTPSKTINNAVHVYLVI